MLSQQKLSAKKACDFARANRLMLFPKWTHAVKCNSPIHNTARRKTLQSPDNDAVLTRKPRRLFIIPEKIEGIEKVNQSIIRSVGMVAKRRERPRKEGTPE